MTAFKYLLFLLLLSSTTLYGQVQNNNDIIVQMSKEKINVKGVSYYLHTVKKGENLYKIGKAYNVTLKDIVVANPETLSESVKDGSILVKDGSILKIPVNPGTIKKVSQIEDDKFIRHIVEQGQTIFFLTQKYKISQEDLFKYNPELEVSSTLQTGQVVSIPKNSGVAPEKTNVKPSSVYNDYKVKHKDTKYSISRQFNISVNELIAANPILNSDDPKIGQILQIPVKEGVIFVKKTEPVIETAVNEKIKEHNANYTAFSESFKIALFVPFFLEENETISMVDSIANMTSESDKRSETNEVFQRTQNFIEFYQGLLFAIDSLKKCGLKVKLYTYDSGKDTLKINKILRKPELSEMDLIIGPFYTEPAERVANFCLDKKIKMVSPVANSNKIVKNNPYVFEVMPNESIYIDATLNYIDKIPNKHIIFIQSDRPGDQKISELYKQKLDARHTNYKNIKYNDNSNQINALLNSSKENIIIFPTEDEGLVSIIFPVLNKQISKDSIKVFGLPICVKFKNLDMDYFYNLEFHYPSSFYADFSNNRLLQKFLNKYKNYNYGEPYYHSREGYPYLFTKEGYNFAYLGYDIAFYFLNNLGKYGKDFDTQNIKDKPSLLHSSFNFERLDPQSGFVNKGVNIIHYTQDFKVERTLTTTHYWIGSQSSAMVAKK